MIEEKNALVSGGAGFLGSFLCEELLKQGFTVFALDNLKTGKRSFINHLLTNPHFNFVETDINEKLPKIPAKIGYIFHLAATISHPLTSEANLEEVLANSLGTKNLLEIARADNSKFLLCSSIYVYSGIISTQDLEHYFGETRQERFSLLEAKRFAEALAWEYYKRYNLDIRIVRLSDVYGPRMDLDANETLPTLIRNLFLGKELTVYGDGKNLEYYLYARDAVEGILAAMLSGGTRGKIFPLAPQEPIPSEEIAQEILSLAPKEAKIARHKGITKPLLSPYNFSDVDTLAQIDWKPKVDLHRGLRQTLEAFGWDIKQKKFSKEEPPPLIRTPEKRIPKISLKLSQKNLLKFFLSLALLGLLGMGSLLGATVWQIRSATGALLQGDFGKAAVNFEEASKNLARFGRVFFFFNDLDRLSSSASVAFEAAGDFANAGEKLFPVWEALAKSYRKEAAEIPRENLLLATHAISEAQRNLSLSQGLAKEIRSSRIRSLASPFLSRLEAALALSQGLDKAFAQVPELLGLNGERYFLILFANNTEARAGGGFLGSLAFLALDGGKISKLEFYNTYDFDSSPEPAPSPLVKGLNSPRWTLRESNFFADFRESAINIAKLYRIAKGPDALGVFSLDLNFAKDLVSLTGPLFLPSYGETITPENLYEKTQFYAEAGFFPGSNQKEGFLEALSVALLDEVLSLETSALFPLFQKVSTALDKKHLVVFTTNQDLASYLRARGWDGGIPENYHDFLAILDQSYGSKVNPQIQRKIAYQLENPTREGYLSAKLEVTYPHLGKISNWAQEGGTGGTYQNFMRITLPKGATLRTSFADDKPISLIPWEESGLSSYFYFFKLEPEKEIKLTFVYDFPLSFFDITKDKTYSLYFLKQPGYEGETFEFRFTRPFGKSFKNIPLNAKVEGDTLVFVISPEKDLTLEVELE